MINLNRIYWFSAKCVLVTVNDALLRFMAATGGKMRIVGSTVRNDGQCHVKWRRNSTPSLI